MTHEKRRYSAEDYILAAAWIDPTSGNKAREFHELLTHAASTEAQLMGLVEAMEQIESQQYDKSSTYRSISREALSKFRGESNDA